MFPLGRFEARSGSWKVNTDEDCAARRQDLPGATGRDEDVTNDLHQADRAAPPPTLRQQRRAAATTGALSRKSSETAQNDDILATTAAAAAAEEASGNCR